MSHNSPTRHVLDIGKRGSRAIAMALQWVVVVDFAVVRSKNFQLELCGEIKKATEMMISNHRIDQS